MARKGRVLEGWDHDVCDELSFGSARGVVDVMLDEVVVAQWDRPSLYQLEYATTGFGQLVVRTRENEPLVTRLRKRDGSHPRRKRGGNLLHSHASSIDHLWLDTVHGHVSRDPGERLDFGQLLVELLPRLPRGVLERTNPFHEEVVGSGAQNPRGVLVEAHGG